MHIHEIEEIEYREGPRLWDATPGVCCAAFQLGACEHTEAYDPYDYDADMAAWVADNGPLPVAAPVAITTAEEPF